ncbi:AraC family transcriptional regulator [Psychroserpens damuponensis]|uniref:AraC family transcriptional regulator n=1 Tax=Psychroserpens damuponensis TaxID=943936 RepID=UPI00058D7259|nr:AraC family transcriptional regulator [Psychroserpens damuponensis]
MKIERKIFIEKSTEYKFDNGLLTIYETNSPCKDILFTFDKYMITIMLSGHKTVVSKNVKVEFFPGMVFIPEKDTVQTVEISNASFSNPTKCLVLDVEPKFIEKLVLELLEDDDWKANFEYTLNEKHTHFISNDSNTIESFERFYKYLKLGNTGLNSRINNVILHELILRVLQTEAGSLLIENVKSKIKDRNLEKTIRFIKMNLRNKITINDLVGISGFGKTKLFNRFKETFGVTPVNYIMKERIKYSLKIIKSIDSLQSVAFQSGFNTYEHFCKSFKKIEGISPMAYKKKKISNENVII